jgi:hypothetical protein
VSEAEGQHRAVLIGIDAYRSKPLSGAVNDIDAVQRLLIERAGVPPENIRRLASPRAGRPRGSAIPEVPASLENIRAALDELATLAQPGDRVLIYYSGHGARVPFALPGDAALFREAIVPAGADVGAVRPEQLLFDHELNERLAEIAQRTPSVSCILDCCHSAGVTRAPALEDAMARCLEPHELGWTAPPITAVPEPATAAAPTRGEALELSSTHHLVAACLDYELAVECPAAGGAFQGLFTRALLRALAGISDPELTTVPWSRIWPAIRAEVEQHNPAQHVWMSGSPARAILGGPPVDGDPGLPIRRAGDAYEIGAGTLESITEGAVLAVYGEQPLRFPALGSDVDRAARRGLLRVTSAHADRARAVVLGAPFALPPGARGRLVEAGAAARLRCALVPPNEIIAAELRASPLLEVVDAGAARVLLQQDADSDRWLLVDDVHEATKDEALFVLRPEDLGHAREILELYFHYALPQRLAESLRDLPGALELQVLAYDRELSAFDAQEADLPEAPTWGRSAYCLRSGARVCFRVRNRSRERLRVALLNSAASGKVQILGNQIIDGQSAKVFWARDKLGVPFEMTLPPGKQQGIDRLIAVGTTAMSKNLGYLGFERMFADIVAPWRGVPRGEDHRKDVIVPPPGERWTAARALVTTTSMLRSER